jgi:malonyl-CoA/methylmalonyl-CoA synthetase
LAAFARERVAPYKVPRALRVVPALPRNAMGKVQKKQLLVAEAKVR